jgi:hypothetical protein
MTLGTTVGRAEFLQALSYFHSLDPSLIHARGGTKGLTPFHVVSLHYSETVGAFLHAKGADINAESFAGHTPLDLLHFHDDGDRGAEEHLTIDYRNRSSDGTPRTGVAICDYGDGWAGILEARGKTGDPAEAAVPHLGGGEGPADNDAPNGIAAGPHGGVLVGRDHGVL